MRRIAAHRQVREPDGVCGHTSSAHTSPPDQDVRIDACITSYRHRTHGCFLHDGSVMQSAVQRFASVHGNKGTARLCPHWQQWPALPAAHTGDDFDKWAAAFHACDWRASRNTGCAEIPWAICAVESVAGTPHSTPSWCGACCDEHNPSSESATWWSSTESNRWFEIATR